MTPKSIKDSFNRDYAAKKENDNVLTVRYGIDGYPMLLAFDYMARVMVSRLEGYPSAGATVTPFSQLDRDTLVEFRDKLIDLGGKPPELPAEAPANPGVARKAGGLNP